MATSGERLPEFLPSECLGRLCPNFSDQPCKNSQMEWMNADGPKEGRDTSKPPLRNEATYITYGKRCLEGAEPQLVAQRVEIFKSEEVEHLALVALTGRYGDMPVEIVDGNRVTTIETIASSD